MPAPTLPTEDEVEDLILGPDSIVWQRFGDIRVFQGAGAALMLQVAHPTVGAGVHEHSNFLDDPWGRLMRTTDYLNLLVYGGHEAAAVGRRLRSMHERIKGTKPDGSRYHALEPEAYAWVHATLIEAGIAAYRRFVSPLSDAEAERFYREYLPLGRLLGIRTDALPPDWAGFRAYVDEMVETRLERTRSVEDVLTALSRPAPPPVLPDGAAPIWRLLRRPPAHVLKLATNGLLTPGARRRLGLRWSAAAEAELRALGAVSRSLDPVLPARLRCMGPAWLEWRREEIAAGPLGSGADGERELSDAA